MILRVLDWWTVSVIAVSFGTTLALIGLNGRFRILSGGAGRLQDVQAAHKKATARVGGVAIYAALIFGSLLMPPEITPIYFGALAATLILFSVGLCEDLGFGVSPKIRLFTMALASLILIGLTGNWIPRMGAPFLDAAISHWAIGIPFTLFVTAAVTNGFNLIDGVNGLSSSTAIIGALALGAISAAAGVTDLAYLAIIFSAAVLGFWLLNFPFGLIFLGDAGAYSIGFFLSWMGIIALERIPDLSPWAVLLIMFWPLLDTMLAIYRRYIRARDRMAPDRLHVHQLVMRALEVVFFGKHNRRITNPLTTVVLLPFVITPAVVGVVFWDKNLWCALAALMFILLFCASYYGMFYYLTVILRGRSKNDFIKALVVKEGQSRLSGLFVQDSIALNLIIEKDARDGAWSWYAESAGHENFYTPHRFRTDQSAWESFLDQVNTFGIESVTGPPKAG